MNKLIFLLVLLVTVSCGTSKEKLSDEGKSVEVLPSSGGSGCEVVDKVVGVNDKGSVALAKNHTRNLAAKAGGNSVYYDDIVRNGKNVKVFATAFQCE